MVDFTCEWWYDATEDEGKAMSDQTQRRADHFQANLAYTVYVTVNRANGTDYDMAELELASHSELSDYLEAVVPMANRECIEESEFPASSIIITVVPH